MHDPRLAKKLIEQKHLDVTAWKNLEALLELRDCSVERLSAARYAGRL
jgi:hypothetical protein